MASPDRYWPASDPPGPEESVEVVCEFCGLAWRIHQDLSGSRMRCDCRAWIEVPGPKQAAALTEGEDAANEVVQSADTEGAGSSLVPVSDGAALQPIDLNAGTELEEAEFHPLHKPLEGRDVPLDMPMRAGSLRSASTESRQKWTNRSALELALMLGAIMLPQLLLGLLVPPHRQAQFLPLASLVGGLLVLGVGLFAGHYTYGALRRCKASFFFEALGATALFLVLVHFYSQLLPKEITEQDPLALLRDELGIGWALFVIALSPAILEELAFRGLLQGRLSALYGRVPGIIVTGAAFAIAHGITLGYPFHAALGMYLCWLRARSESLYPGIMLHFLYNGTLVLLS